MSFYNNYDTSTLLCLVLPVVITSTAVVLVIGDAGEKWCKVREQLKNLAV
jgi:hypothetical protein